jgi:RNA polymerase sigma-70 factor, ECF subfamily
LEKKLLIPMKTLNEISFEQLFRSEYKGLCFFALRYVRDMEAAKEIVQDSFLSLWEKRESIDLEKSVKSYIATSIRNKCLNYLRHNKKYYHDLLPDDIQNGNLFFESNDLLMETELQARINKAINELPDKCREVFLLSRYDNLKYNEIAARLQISVKTVETQMSKALQLMRQRLSDYLALLLLLCYFFFNLY